MRLHSNVLTVSDIIKAARDVAPGVSATAQAHGSRTHRAAYEFRVVGNGPTGAGFSSPDLGPSGTWDEWGVVLARLFDLDSRMVAGRVNAPTYADADEFHGMTVNRFRSGSLPADTHARHKWDRYSGGAYCTKCSAEQSWSF